MMKKATGQRFVTSARSWMQQLCFPRITAPIPRSLRPSFDWGDVSGPGAVTYTIQISKNNTFTQIVQTGNPVTSSYVPTADLPKNLPLFWRVQTKGANGPSAWSEVRSFFSANSPTTPDPEPACIECSQHQLHPALQVDCGYPTCWHFLQALPTAGG